MVDLTDQNLKAAIMSCIRGGRTDSREIYSAALGCPTKHSGPEVALTYPA
jgi:hypothetical protein